MKDISLKLMCALLVLLFISCQKSGVQSKQEEPEVSLEQEAKMLQNEKGESVSVVYFAKGDEVAVKITINGEEQELSAKGVSPNGEPIFTNGSVAWEMLQDGQSGRLTDKEGNSFVYK